MKIKGRVFVVTGGASGLGEGTCRMVTANGGKVVIVDIQEDRAADVIKSLPKGSAHFIKMDATNEQSIENAIEAAGKKWGRIDGCVNCAGAGGGISTVNRKGVPHSMKKFEFIVRLNLLGTFSVASKCAAWMVKNDPDENGERGTIINVASVAATDGQNGQAAYSASKAGVVGMALPMARDLGSRGVRVNTIMPGIMATPMTAGFDTPAGARVGDNLKQAQVFPTNRFGVPAEFAELAKFLIESPIMNAEAVRFDGGIRMRKFFYPLFLYRSFSSLFSSSPSPLARLVAYFASGSSI